MNIQYFKSAWGDIKNSPGWFGKLCLLALLNFIPVFGQIVTLGYIYGWAREIAWGTHEPMPSKVFANEDGKFWRRGWFVFVLAFVFALIPQIVVSLGNYLQATGAMHTYVGNQVVTTTSMLSVLGSVLSLIGYLGAVAVGVLTWIGGMRVSIYDRLSAGFQLGTIWKMLRHDTNGILRIFGMSLLFELILGIILSIIITILAFVVVFVGVAGLVNAGYSAQSIQSLTESQAAVMFMHFISSAGFVGFFAVLVGCFLTFVVGAFVQLLVVRAVGYWTMQFEVPKWRGQDDPLPFEVAGATQAQVQQPTMYAAQQPQAYSQQMPPNAQQTYGQQVTPETQQVYGQQMAPETQQAYGQQPQVQQPYNQQMPPETQQTYNQQVTPEVQQTYAQQPHDQQATQQVQQTYDQQAPLETQQMYGQQPQVPQPYDQQVPPEAPQTTEPLQQSTDQTQQSTNSTPEN